MTTVVEVCDLRVELTGSGSDIVDGVSFSIEEGELVGLVGESGSGKTTIAAALMGVARRGARVAGGSIVVDGRSIGDLGEEELRSMRGKTIAYVPQDPAAALNPALRVGTQLREVLETHGLPAGCESVDDRLGQVLAEVRLAGGREVLRRFPHQLSGGQQQRICIAMAFVAQPRVLVFDEPTTALDVTTQAHVLQTIREMCGRHGVAGLYVTHDLAVVAGLAQRVLVLYAGRMAESGPREEIFRRAAHPYTRKLIEAIPDLEGRRALQSIPGQAPAPGHRPHGCEFAPRCSYVREACTQVVPVLEPVGAEHAARCLRVHELPPYAPAIAAATERRDTADAGAVLSVSHLDASYGDHRVLHGASLTVARGECLALVGESGSGKTTLARAIAGLHLEQRGEIRLDGELLHPRARSRSAEVRRTIQYIFQSPYNSLNPRRTIGQALGLPIKHFFGVARAEERRLVEEALERVGLPGRSASMYPGQLSGGERQRASIARALLCKPTVLVCDEVTSALDVSVQASIVRLLGRLQEEEDLAMLFVTHNLALVRSVADRVLVLQDGRVVETGMTDSVLDEPAEAYTRELISDTPALIGAHA
jgi:peptide/nickel transport system ATP-binding protein